MGARNPSSWERGKLKQVSHSLLVIDFIDTGIKTKEAVFTSKGCVSYNYVIFSILPFRIIFLMSPFELEWDLWRKGPLVCVVFLFLGFNIKFYPHLMASLILLQQYQWNLFISSVWNLWLVFRMFNRHDFGGKKDRFW